MLTSILVGGQETTTSGDVKGVSVDNVGPSNAVPLREVYDVVVVGSGGAGLTAALAAAVKGSRVLVVESAARFGGVDLGVRGKVWVPGTHRAAELSGEADTIKDARTYCLHHSPGRDPGWAARLSV